MYNIEIDIKNALDSEKPIEKLTIIAKKMYKKGLNSKQIYDIFLRYDISIGDNSDKKDILEDFMDMITNWYIGRDINLSE
ncbi:hypothetical protein [Capnocytophaga canis]|nr:hypothetical protein [Capnocytophaga canis]